MTENKSIPNNKQNDDLLINDKDKIRQDADVCENCGHTTYFHVDDFGSCQFYDLHERNCRCKKFTPRNHTAEIEVRILSKPERKEHVLSNSGVSSNGKDTANSPDTKSIPQLIKDRDAFWKKKVEELKNMPEKKLDGYKGLIFKEDVLKIFSESGE